MNFFEIQELTLQVLKIQFLNSMEDTQQKNINNEFHHYHNISINVNSVIQKITPPILFSLTLLAIVKMDGRPKELLYPLGGFAGLCIWNNFW